MGRLAFLCVWLLGCGSPTSSLDYNPSTVPVGPLKLGAWLPAGLDRPRFGAADQQMLVDLGLNQVEWLQRDSLAGGTMEEAAMDFCSRVGLEMPVYYEPPGFTPYDKLHNWAKKPAGTEDFAQAVTERAEQLRTHWEGQAGFGGYLVGHEDYDSAFYGSLGQVVEILGQVDAQRPAITVGHIDHYSAVNRFLDAFFVAGGVPNIFQHEHYVFRAEVPAAGGKLQRQLRALVGSYDRVARLLQGRHGRWHAIVQVQSEVRQGELYYRKPSAAEIKVQAGMALTRGAAGIVYFLYSSGEEQRRNQAGELLKSWRYEGLVNAEGEATASYWAVQGLNTLLRQVGTVLAPLHFHGGFSSGDLPTNPVVDRGAADLEFGLFGDGVQISHLLVVNRRPSEGRQVELGIRGQRIVDALSGAAIIGDPTLRIDLEAGGLRLFEVDPIEATSGD